MELSLIAFGFGMASIFGFIVGLFSVWNGRMTRREISRLITEEARTTKGLITEEVRATRDLLAKMDERAQRQTEILQKMDERTAKMDEDSKRGREEFQRILDKMDERAERQRQMLERMEQNQRYIADLVKTEAERIIHEVQ